MYTRTHIVIILIITALTWVPAESISVSGVVTSADNNQGLANVSVYLK